MARKSWNFDRAVIRALKWWCLGIPLCLISAWIGAWLSPGQPAVYSSNDPNLPADIASFFAFTSRSGHTGTMQVVRFELRPENGPIAQWCGMLGGSSHFQAEDYGWPIPAWSVWHEMDCDTPARVIAGVALHKPRPVSAEASFVPTPKWALPIVPRLHLVAASAAIYGATAWLVVAGAKRTVAHARASRGRCGRCNYDLSATMGACPECGTHHNNTPTHSSAQ